MAELPAYNIPNALIDFAPVQNALSGVMAQNNANREYGLQQQQSARADEQLALTKKTTVAQLQNMALEHERNMAQAYGGWAQTIQSNPDPAARAALTKQLIASHPEFATTLQKNGVDPNDPDKALSFITSEAQGYQNPLDVQAKKASIAATNSTIGLNEQKMKLAKRQFDFTSNLINGGGQPQAATMPPVPGARQAPDGNYYVPDPARPGKYLMVQP